MLGMGTSKPRSGAQFGFTLIELLIVAAIVAVLLSILLPAIHSSRQSATRVQCASNMRQIVLGIRSLPHDYKHLGESEQAEAMLNERRVRICPEDPKGDARLRDHGSSYVDNRPSCNPHVPIATSKTIVLLEAAEGDRSQWVDPCEWFSPADAASNGILSAIRNQIDLDRHGASANYAYADGHVQTIPAVVIMAWTEKPMNFGLRNQGEYND
jgi:prepilin-type N-terminal cleavage/methylation domain-containing protein/prepilin-type processing-associated H-X9-DG protein